jgi:VWFA-related protein
MVRTSTSFARARRIAAFAMLGCAPGWVLAQQAAAPPPPSGEVVLRANSSLVLVDVVVTGRGKVVHGLGRDKFRIYENGRLQPITAFEEHTAGSSSRAAATAPAAPALPPDTYTNRPESGPAADLPAVNVLLLDALNTPIGDQMQVRRQMLDALKKIPAGTHMAVFTLASRLRMVRGFTADAGVLAKAISGAKGSPQTSVILDPQTTNLLASTTAGQPSTGPGNQSIGGPGSGDAVSAGMDAASTMAQFQADLNAYQTDQRVSMTMDAMQQLARYLAAIPGRKNLIWFSGSFPINLLADDTLPDPFSAHRDYSEALFETDSLLSAARVAVYPVDARGLITPTIYDASFSMPDNLMGSTSAAVTKRGGGRIAGKANGGSLTALNKANSDATRQLMAEQASLEQMAADTGGHAFLNGNDLGDALARAMEDGGNYYTVGYIPDAAHLDGKFHKLNVKMTDGGYELAYRPGFYAGDAASAKGHTGNTIGTASMMVAASIHGAPPATQIVFEARILPSRTGSLPGGAMTAALKGPIQRYSVDLLTDARGLRLASGDGGARLARLEYTLVAFDPDGKRLNYADDGFQFTIRPSQYDMVMQRGLPFHGELDLPRGEVFLRIAVHDLASDHVGSLEIPLHVTAVTP